MTYLNVEEVESAIVNLSAKYQNLSRLVTLLKPTIEGRICHALNIGREMGSKNTVFFTGGVHAREWGSSEICVYFAPCVNPDGRHYSQTSHPLWRRNRNPSESGGNPNCLGVDINRNYDFLWDFHKHFSPKSKVYTSSNPCDQDQVYRGSAPFSEPETQNVKWLFDNSPMIKWYIDIHSYGEDILYSWGDDENQSDNPSMNFIDPLYNSKRGVEYEKPYKEYIPNADLVTAEALANSIRDGIEAVRWQEICCKTWISPLSYVGSG